jgi:hypothetical protein
MSSGHNSTPESDGSTRNANSSDHGEDQPPPHDQLLYGAVRPFPKWLTSCLM